MDRFKKATPFDFETFAQWEKEMRPYPWSVDQFRQADVSLSTRLLVWKGFRDRNGYIILQIVDQEAYIQNIMIDPANQGKGWGKTLLDMAEAWCREKKILTLRLEVDPQNEKAVRLYSKAGFQVVGSRKNAYPNGERATVMMKRI